jgi:hypothetical protein
LLLLRIIRRLKSRAEKFKISPLKAAHLSFYAAHTLILCTTLFSHYAQFCFPGGEFFQAASVVAELLINPTIKVVYIKSVYTFLPAIKDSYTSQSSPIKISTDTLAVLAYFSESGSIGSRFPSL